MNRLDEGWLYLPKEVRDWNLDTAGLMVNCDELNPTELDEEFESIEAKSKGLISTLDSDTIEDIVSFATKNLNVPITDDILFESFQYYFEYDAFLTKPGFKPLPKSEIHLKLDRDFYDRLGSERPDVPCRESGCNRGAISNSIYCRVHHFQSIKKKSCPFTD